MRGPILLSGFFLMVFLVTGGAAAGDLKVAVFDCDATPAVGSALAYDPMKEAGVLTLRCRGLVLTGAGDPVVLCSVDWLGIANAGHDAFRAALAEAAGTTPERVAVHAGHQHDAPVCDFSSAQLLAARRLAPPVFAEAVTRPAIERAVAAVKAGLTAARPVSHVGYGEARVYQVASNRRILDETGKVRAVRYTACADPALRAEPEGVIDPIASVVSLWDGDVPVVALTYYATHPQSFYRTGVANPDFPGIARFLRDQAVPGLLHVHFNGAGGNIGAGKYNDGSPVNRHFLAARLASGLEAAWVATHKSPLVAADVGWDVEKVALPPAAHLDEAALQAALEAPGAVDAVLGQAMQLAWLQRCRAGHQIDLPVLHVGPVSIVHLPGELFVEYQLAAKAMRPDRRVVMAAYGDYGPGYIGTARSYAEGGYETEPRASFVDPSVENVLTEAMKRLLDRRK
jgi:hypothetical protein